MNNTRPKQRPNVTARWRWLIITALAIAIALMFAQYLLVKRSHFDDTFIYLHIAQNAIESGTWQYFPNTDRPALLASSPLRIVVLTAATFIAWPLTQGLRTFESAALVLPISAALSCLLFLPFWWRDRSRFLLFAIPYFLFAASFEAVAEFEAGLLYWWVATIMRDYIDRVNTPLTAIAGVLGFFIRPDVGIVVFTILLLAYGARDELNKARLRAWLIAAAAITISWTALCAALSVWPVPVTYWTKGALPQLFDPNQMISVIAFRLAVAAFGPTTQSLTVSALVSLLWILTFAMIGARSDALRGWRILLATLVATAVLSRLPASYFWYFQNIWIAGSAAAIALVICANKSHAARSIAIVFACFSLAVPIGSRMLRENDLPWHFDKPSRVQGYLAMAKTFDRAGTIELPGFGRGHLKNPEIGITAYFGGRNSWIWDSAGLAQPHPDAQESLLRYFYRKRLRKPPAEDILKLTGGAPAQIFEAWALENRDPKAHANCLHVLLDGSVCISRILAKTP
jgi:hypothetical protein